MHRRKKNKGPCATIDCWEGAMCAGYCNACYVGIHMLMKKTVGELAFYYKRRTRLVSRATTLLSRRKRHGRAA